MDKLSYLLSLETTNPREIYDTWVSLGSMTCNNRTKLYNQECIFKVVEEGTMYGALIYCNAKYQVIPSENIGAIDWTSASVTSVNNKIYFYQGVASPNFTVILKPTEFAEIDTSVETSDDFIPFNNNTETALINISDYDFTVVCSELGLPFLRPEELEYNKETLTNYCIAPALDVYYSKFPIIIDEEYQYQAAGTTWEAEFHNFPDDPSSTAFDCIPYYTLGAGGTSATTYGAGAFNFLRSEMMCGATAGYGGFGNGIRYRKNVPGFVGMEGMDAALMGMATVQGYANLFRREHYKTIFKNGKKYISGYSSIGGSVNLKWLCKNKDFSRIEYGYLPQVRKLCTAKALRNIGMLRSLIKPNDNSPIDYSLYTGRADALEQEVMNDWKEVTFAQSLAIERGGL